MNIDAMIDAYVQDVVQLLPRKQRKDVALELRGLVCEELQSRATAQEAPLNTEITLQGLRAFGKPQDVAARYFEPWVIIPQTETRKFAFAAVIGALVLVALSPLNDASVRSSHLAIGIFAWLGALVCYFSVRSLVDLRRRNGANLWVPRERDSVSRPGALLIIAVIGLGMVAYGAPGWLFSQLGRGRSLPAWLEYDHAFHSVRLPVLFFLWGCQAALFAVLAIRGRWNTVLRRVDVSLEIAVAVVLIWFLAAGRVFIEDVPNRVALNALSTFALLVFIDVGIKLYRGASRGPLSDSLRSQTN